LVYSAKLKERGKDGNDGNTDIDDPPRIKKPVYDVLGYTTDLAVKMTELAKPNHIVIGQLVYDISDNYQKSTYKQLNISSEVRNYVNSTAEGIFTMFIPISEQ
jgi:hypothetical protein